MKGTTVLFGSPRRGGNSESLAEAFLRGAGEKAGEIFRFHLEGPKAISGCMDCRQCWTGGKPCVLDDSMQEIYEALRRSELILFVSPLYWYTWSGQIKLAIDRFLPFVSENALYTLKGKKSILFSTAGDTDPDCFDGLRFAYRASCELLGLESLLELLAHGIYRRGDIDGTEWLDRAERFGKSL